MSLFEMNLYGRLYALCEAINSRTYTPTANYAFIHYRPKPREVFAAEPELKIIMTYLDMRINRLIDRKLTDRAFNNRVGKGTHAAVNQVMEDIYECSEGFAKPCWVIKLDIMGYFPHMNQDRSFALVRDVIENDYEGDDKDELLYLAQIACYCNPQERCDKRSKPTEWEAIAPYKSLFRKPFGTGGAIGFVYWQVASNHYLADEDRWIIENMTPRYVRYVDDMTLVTDNKNYVLSRIPELRERLARIGVRLHPTKFSCQWAAKGLEFLGYHIKRNAVHVNRKIVHRAMIKAGRHHRIHYMETINSYLGILKSGSDRKALEDVMNRVPDKYIKDKTHWKIKQAS